MAAEERARGICVGVDGGGSSTRVQCVVTATGEPIGEVGISTCSNHNSVGAAAAQQAVCAAIQQSLDSLPAPFREGPVHIDAILLSMSGVDRPDDCELVSKWPLNLALFQPGPAASRAPSISVFSDAVAALAAGTGGELFGAVVISGTGMAVFVFDRQGQPSRAGGWGPLLGEPCSGYTIGSRALQAVTRAVDGVGPATSLTAALLAFLSLSEPTQLIPWTYSDITWARFAKIAPLVFEHRAQGDSVATQIIDSETDQLVDTLVAALKSAALPSDSRFPVVCSGGNFTHHDKALFHLFAEKIALRRVSEPVLAGAELSLPSLSPELAAALLARNRFLQP